MREAVRDDRLDPAPAAVEPEPPSTEADAAREGTPHVMDGWLTTHLERVEQIMYQGASGDSTFVTNATTYLAATGGKRLRPKLCLASSYCVGRPNRNVYLIAAAGEMTHLATLYHDDVIDGAETRRSVPSANVLLGNSVSILAGDYLLARASHLAAQVGGAATEILSNAVAAAVRGEMREIESVGDADRTTDHYLVTISEKTASLMEAACVLGGLLTGGAEGVVARLATFGREFGMAFQIADDLLDFTGTLEQLGKEPGTDLREGVYTLPLILGFEADPDLRRACSNGDFGFVLSRLRSTGAFDAARSAMEAYKRRALLRLVGLPSGDGRSYLESITRRIGRRT